MSEIEIYSDAFGGIPVGARRDDEGRYSVFVESRIRVRGTLWTYDNPLGLSSSVFRPRSVSDFQVTLPHGSRGIYDQTIQVHHTLTSGGSGIGLRLRMRTVMTTATGNPYGPTIYDRTIPTDHRLTLAPEVGASVASTSDRSIDELVELRMPYWEWRMIWTPTEAPDAGDISIFTCWRQ